jgi:single-strand DNA-binding protein
MPNLNAVFLIGNLCRDPEVRYTAKGLAVTEIDLAINRSYSGEDGQKHEEVTFVNCVVWGRLAEVAQQYLKKGSPVCLTGRLQTDTWEDKQSGQKRSRLRVVGENIQLLGRREGTEAAPSAPAPPASSRPTAPVSPTTPPRTTPREHAGVAAFKPALDIDLDVDEPF